MSLTKKVLKWELIARRTLNSNSQDLISNSPYYLPYDDCYDVNLENLALEQLIIP